MSNKKKWIAHCWLPPLLNLFFFYQIQQNWHIFDCYGQFSCTSSGNWSIQNYYFVNSDLFAMSVLILPLLAFLFDGKQIILRFCSFLLLGICLLDYWKIFCFVACLDYLIVFVRIFAWFCKEFFFSRIKSKKIK